MNFFSYKIPPPHPPPRVHFFESCCGIRSFISGFSILTISGWVFSVLFVNLIFHFFLICVELFFYEREREENANIFVLQSYYVFSDTLSKPIFLNSLLLNVVMVVVVVVLFLYNVLSPSQKNECFVVNYIIEHYYNLKCLWTHLQTEIM